MTRAKSLLAACVLLSTIGHASTSLADQPLAAADNAFGFELLKHLAEVQPATNIFISPYSAATVLEMVENGAAGKTKAEMQQVLGTTGLAPDGVNAAHKDVAESLEK